MIKFAVVAFLKANAGVMALVGAEVFPRRLPNQPALPALVIHKISERREVAHSGDVGLTTTRIQVDVRAKTDLQVENIKTAVKSAMHLYSGLMDSLTVKSCFLEDDGDLFDEDMFEMDDLGGNLDFIVTWKE